MKVEPLPQSQMPLPSSSASSSPSPSLNSQIQNKNIRKTSSSSSSNKASLEKVSVSSKTKQKKLSKQKQAQKHSPSKILLESQESKPRLRRSRRQQYISNCSTTVLHNSNNSSQGEDEEETSKLIKCDTLSTRRLLAIGDHILDFSEDILKKRPSLFVSAQLHPHNPRLGFIQFRSSTELKMLEELLLNDNSNKYKNLQIRPVEKMNNWKKFFDSPNSFFPDYKSHSMDEVGQTTGNSDLGDKLNAISIRNQDVQNTIDVENQKMRRRRRIMKNDKSNMQLQMISTNLKQEEDECCNLQPNMQQLQPLQMRNHSTASYEHQNQNLEDDGALLPQAITTSSILNLNSNPNNNNLNNKTNKNQSLSSASSSSSSSCFRSELNNPFNQNQKFQQVYPNQSLHKYSQQISSLSGKSSLLESKLLIPQNEQIYIELTQILCNHRNWESLLELVAYISQSKDFSQTKKTQMLFAIGKERAAFESVMQLNQLYEHENFDFN